MGWYLWWNCLTMVRQGPMSLIVTLYDLCHLGVITPWLYLPRYRENDFWLCKGYVPNLSKTQREPPTTDLWPWSSKAPGDHVKLSPGDSDTSMEEYSVMLFICFKPAWDQDWLTYNSYYHRYFSDGWGWCDGLNDPSGPADTPLQRDANGCPWYPLWLCITDQCDAVTPGNQDKLVMMEWPLDRPCAVQDPDLCNFLRVFWFGRLKDSCTTCAWLWSGYRPWLALNSAWTLAPAKETQL